MVPARRGAVDDSVCTTRPSDFANDYHNAGLSFLDSNAKNFLTKSIFMYLMVGSIIPS